MEFSNEFEVISEVEVSLEDCTSKDNILCYCSRVWCDDYHDYKKGAKGKHIKFFSTVDWLANRLHDVQPIH